MTAKEELAKKVADAVGAGRPVAVETVDFADPNRPKTCLEVDFPILPVNQVAAIEGNAGKPIYQMSKWWARRRSSVFRSMLLSAAMKAPADEAKADKAVWDVYYANHQKKGALKHLKVADIFMGGGTTIVEGSRLGMQMYGNDLNPVAWFVVKNELAQVDRKEVEALLADVEREVKPQIMPFYAYDCPRGHKGTWTQLSTGKVMGAGFDPLALTPEQRRDYQYGRWRTKRGTLMPLDFDIARQSEKDRNGFYFDAIELTYTFWSKHGPCAVTGCGHRTPIMTSPVMAIKTMTVRAWIDRPCRRCKAVFDVEDGHSRMAPGVPLVSSPDEKAWAVYTDRDGVTCPACRFVDDERPQGKPKNKKLNLSLLVHPSWLAGSPRTAPDGTDYGGSVTDTPAATAAWNRERASKLRLLEVRGKLPPTVTCPETGVTFSTGTATVPKRSNYACGSCGTVQDVLTTVKATRKTGPVAAYAIQGYCPCCDAAGENYGGRFFAPAINRAAFEAAATEWGARREVDLAPWWPRSELPFGFMTHKLNGGIPNHGLTHWHKMFAPRQLLLHAQMLRAVQTIPRHRQEARDFVLGALEQYLQAQTMMCWWNIQTDRLAVGFSANNFHPKSTLIEGGNPWGEFGHSRWASCARKLLEALDWCRDPEELVSAELLRERAPDAASAVGGKSAKVPTRDPVLPGASVLRGSATDLPYAADSMDLVVTDPPFGGLLHYSELSDFFYVWLRLALGGAYPEAFGSAYSPKGLEVVANPARNPEDSDAFYKRLLTDSWREAHRILKPGGILAFTFHHSEDEPWVDVLEALFDAGFYLAATYPIRSDETKGEGEFGSRTIEYDIIHVCRKKLEDPKPVSWARLRRQILTEARRLEELLSRHKKAGLPEADIAVVRRGKALEYFSKHYNRVYLEDGQTMPVKDALAGINQVLDQDAGGMVDPPPSNAIPFTWQFCRMFDQRRQLPRDQMQKYLRGTGYSPPEYEAAGWVVEDDKVFHMVDPKAFAQAWIGKHRSGLRSDYEQAMFLIGASLEGSGINVSDTLGNENFRPHPALGGLLEWFGRRGGDAQIRGAAVRARHLYAAWEQKNATKVKQLNLFSDEGDGA